jgi:hypothetical protein
MVMSVLVPVVMVVLVLVVVMPVRMLLFVAVLMPMRLVGVRFMGIVLVRMAHKAFTTRAAAQAAP